MTPETTSQFRVRVDASNPGQFLACCGLLELATRLWTFAEGWFDDGWFYVASDGTLRQVLVALSSREPTEVTTLDSGLEVKALIAPLRLELPGRSDPLVLDGWMTIGTEKGEVVAKKSPPWNFWSGQQTSHRIWRSLRAELLSMLKTMTPADEEDLFFHRVPTSGRFGFDPVAAWKALDAGFSPNEQHMEVASSPAVELLAALGLQRVRLPVSPDETRFWYATWAVPLSAAVAAPAACGVGVSAGSTNYEGRVISRGSFAALGVSRRVEGGQR